MRKIIRKIKVARQNLPVWWSRQRVLPVALGVYFGLLAVVATSYLM